MSTNYIDIESISSGSEDIVKQDLKFKTGKFVWRIKFTAPLNPSTVNNTNLFVTNSEGSLLSTSIHYDPAKNVIEIEPLAPYAKDSTYILNVTQRVQSKGGQKLKSDIQIRFKV